MVAEFNQLENYKGGFAMWKWETDQEAKAVIVIIHGAMEHHGRYGWLIEMWRAAGLLLQVGRAGQREPSRADKAATIHLMHLGAACCLHGSPIVL